MTTDDSSRTVVIIGGRPAGASLAARLGRAGIPVQIVERSQFPSYPAVSTPFLLAHAMALLDEIDIPESEYARGAPRMSEAVLELHHYFRARLRLGEFGGRDYYYAVDRSIFDDALWRHLERYPSVTTRAGWSATEVLRNSDGFAVGIRARERASRRTEDILAGCVIGADGRYSFVARQMEAAITHRRTDLDTHAYYAFWTDVADYDETGVAMGHIHSSADGWGVVFMPMANGRISVMVQTQSELFEQAQGTPMEIYRRALEERPHVWRRLRSARMVSEVSGIKRMGNLFRDHGGDGWALVGDAYHQKDSIDAQGMYDALQGGKLLAEELIAWHRGDKSWNQAVAAYGERVYADARPMFDATMDRVKRETYSIPPPFVAKNVLRWLIDDPAYKERYGKLLTRRIDPRRFVTGGLVAGALMRGLWGDIKRMFTRRPNPARMPELPAAADASGRDGDHE